MDTISIILPCHNAEHTIRRCMDSILRQTHTDFEVIAVNDGSTDNTGAILDEYAAVDRRVRCCHKENAGVGAARNSGLALAGGTYIQFVDADDHIEPRMLETMLRAMNGSGADLVVCRFRHDCFRQFLAPGCYDLSTDAGFQTFYTDFFSFNVPWNKLLRRALIDQPFHEELKILEDGLFILAYLRNVRRAMVLGDVLYHYYNAGSSGSASLVNSFLQSKFWKNKEGYWYKFNAIKPLFDQLLAACGRNHPLLEYARSFDMAFWELVKLISSGCTEKICVLEMAGILNQPNFIAGIRARGIGYRGAGRAQVEAFVAACFAEYRYQTGANAGDKYHTLVSHFYRHCVTRDAAEPAESGWQEYLPATQE